MQLKSFCCSLATFLYFFFTTGNSAWAQNNWFLGLYGGRATSSNIQEILTLDGAVTDSYLTTFFVGKELGVYRDILRAEAEGQIVNHSGDQDHWEFNSVFILRWLPFFWDDYIDTSVAMGGGLSYATKEPKIETEKNDETAKLLCYYMAEIDFMIPGRSNWSIFGRLHHRSGAWGLFDGVHGGSNILCAGVKYRFD